MKAFVRFEAYDKAHGKVHIRHAMRIKTQRKELEGNPVKVIGNNPLDLLDEGFGVTKTGKRGRSISKPLKEFVVNVETEKDAIKVKEYLERKFDRKVYGVYHDDETEHHAHFMMKGLEEGKDKAIRLGKGDLEQVYRDIGNLLGQGVTRYGQGRERIPFKIFQADPEYAKEQIRMAQEQNEIIKSQVKRILDLYGAIDVYSLSDKGRFLIKENMTSIDDLPLKRLKGINKRGDGIVFCPSKDSPVQAIFIDDVDKMKADTLLSQFQGVLVETSPNSYHLHLRVSPRSHDDLYDAQRSISGVLGGDRASTDLFHLRRLPGFSNPKHDTRPWAKIVRYADKGQILDVEPLIKSFRAERDKQFQVINQFLGNRSIKLTDHEKHELLSSYRKFVIEEGNDYSISDFRFAMHCISSGLSDKEVKDALKAVSLDLGLRKAGHVDDYLDRTITAAKKRLGLVKEKDIKGLGMER